MAIGKFDVIAENNSISETQVLFLLENMGLKHLLLHLQDFTWLTIQSRLKVAGNAHRKGGGVVHLHAQL